MNFDDVDKDCAMYPKKNCMSITTTTKNSKELSVAKSDSSWAYSRRDGESQVQLQKNFNTPPPPLDFLKVTAMKSIAWSHIPQLCLMLTLE